jgi:hypothetical protein
MAGTPAQGGQVKGGRAMTTNITPSSPPDSEGTTRGWTAAERMAADEELRDRALRRLKKKSDLAAHAVVYVLVNAFVVVVWAVTSSGFFWPIFPIAIWGIGLVMNAWDVWRSDGFTEAQVHREMSRLQRRD